MGIIDSLNEIILDKSPAATRESVSERVEQLKGAVRVNRQTTNHVRSAMVLLQEIVSDQSFNTLEVRDYSPHGEAACADQGSLKLKATSREKEVVRKGIERKEKQITQLISVFISRQQVDISLLKKCKTVDVLAVNSVIGNIQRALQKYVGFEGMESEFCDRDEKFIDQAQTWCLNIEDLYNITKVHSINTSKGDAADVSIFNNNSQKTVFDFLEAVELAYLGWGNSVQKANRLYSKHLSEEIKSHLINMSDNYSLNERVIN